MKEKTSITLSTDVLAGIDRLAGSKHSRSFFIEQVLRSYLRQRARQQAQARDLDRLNSAAQRLNAEAADVIEYQGMAGDSSSDGLIEE
jgi:metal-responsive CopG/Arc/MetJ family transcriptional regulator